MFEHKGPRFALKMTDPERHHKEVQRSSDYCDWLDDVYWITSQAMITDTQSGKTRFFICQTQTDKGDPRTSIFEGMSHYGECFLDRVVDERGLWEFYCETVWRRLLDQPELPIPTLCLKVGRCPPGREYYDKKDIDLAHLEKRGIIVEKTGQRSLSL